MAEFARLFQYSIQYRYCTNRGNPLYFSHEANKLHFPAPPFTPPAASRTTAAAPRALILFPLSSFYPAESVPGFCIALQVCFQKRRSH